VGRVIRPWVAAAVLALVAIPAVAGAAPAVALAVALAVAPAGAPIDAVPAVPWHGPVVDALGDTLPAGPRPARIISLSPNTTEVLFAIGVDPERIVGVTRYCDYPPEARNRPQIGGIVDPSIERIQMERPDLVVAARGNPVEILQRIRALGIPVFAVDDRTNLIGVIQIVSEIAAVTLPDDATRGERLLSGMRWELAAYKAWSDSIPDSERPGVYYADPLNPGWTAGPGSHVDDLISLAGGRNIVREGGAWPQFSAERLLVAQPDWILVALPPGTRREEVRRSLSDAPGWSELSALKEGRFCFVDADALLRPGPRVLSALEQAAGCLHPERPRPSAADRRWVRS
jgi:iron complex transport system substrate-binding protein